MPDILQIEAVEKHFGGITALNDCSFAIGEPGIYGLIGPNGAGKTTLFDVMTGQNSADGGSIRLAGAEILGRKAHNIVALGISRTFQECRVFPEKTCLDNLLFSAQRKGLLETFRQVALRSDAERQANANEAMRLLSLVNLESYATEPAADLSFGQRRLLEIVSAFISKPRLLLLDEPTAGVNPVLMTVLRNFIHTMYEQLGIIFLIIEHNMEFIMGLANHIIVMHEGAVLEEGRPEVIKRSARVIESYLG